MSRAKATMEHLMKVEKRMSEFHEQPLNEKNRAMLATEIKNLTKGSEGFYRKDENKIVGLYWGKERMDYGMAPDISITVGNDKKIYVDTWALWKTISGYNEMVQEGM